MTLDSVRLYLVARIWWGVAWSLTTTMSLVYMVVDAGLDPLQMVLVGTALELAVFLFEIPTGVVADLVSRRLSVIIGHAGVGIGLLIVALIPDFWAILLANVFWGVAYTFISGAYPAWLSSEVGKVRAGEAFLRGSQLGHVGAFVGIVAAVGLAHHSLWLPIAAGSVGVIALAVFMAVFMREDHFKPAAAEQRQDWARFKLTLSSGVAEIRSRPVLLLVLAVTAVFGAYSEGLDRLFTPLLLQNFELPPLGPLDGVAWWGIIAAVSQVLGIVAVTAARRRVKLVDVALLTRVMTGALVAMCVLTIALSFAGSLALLLVCFWLSQAARSVYGPLMTAWLNHLLPEQGKATLFSIYGQADALGQTAGGPVIGAIARYVSIAVGLSAASLVLLPGGWLLSRARRVLERETSTQ